MQNVAGQYEKEPEPEPEPDISMDPEPEPSGEIPDHPVPIEPMKYILHIKPATLVRDYTGLEVHEHIAVPLQ